MRGPSRKMAHMEDLLSLREASAEFGIPQKTLQRWVAAGRLPVVARNEGRGSPTLIARATAAEAKAAYVPGRGRRDAIHALA